MAVLLGLASALVYGASDFVGGFATRRASATSVVVSSQLIGALLLVPAVVLLSAQPTTAALAWGAASGLAGGTGVALLYRGLARGTMSVVAPITAVEAAAVPVLAGLLLGERPGVVALGGVVVALLAVVLVSLAPAAPDEPAVGGPIALPVPVAPVRPAGLSERELLVVPDEHRRAPPAPGRPSRGPLRPGVADALGAGLAFGVFFVLLAQAGGDTGLWPLVGARAASVGLLGGVGLLAGRALVPPGPVLPVAGAAGVLDMLANVLFLLATRRGMLAVVAVLTALYPASTVLLARVVLHERLTRTQVGGLATAVVGVVLLAAG